MVESSTVFSPLLMAAAYASFEMAEFIMNLLPIEKIVTSDGMVINAEQESHRAMSEETALFNDRNASLCYD